MASLRNVQGKSLVGDPSKALTRLVKTFGTKQERDKAKKKKKEEEEVRNAIGQIIGSLK